MKKTTGMIFLILLFSCFAGCVSVRQMSVYENIESCIKSDFLENNRVYGAYYKNIDNNEMDLENNTETPSQRVFIIRNQDEFDNIFSESIQDLSVDFETELLVLYTFKCYYRKDPFKLKGVSFSEGNMTLTYELTHSIFSLSLASMPFQRFVLVKIKNTDINSVDFVKK